MLSMPDSTDVAALPPGYGQYLGYVDGEFATANELRKRFPAARLILLTVTGATLAAGGCDIETGDLTEDDGAQWARQKLNREPASRPVLYASVGRMGTVLDRLTVWRVGWRQVRLLSAHYGRGEHICGPSTCRLVSIGMDGTQWTNTFDWQGGPVDMSILADGFFGSWTEEIVQQLPVLRQGDSGEMVKTAQGCLLARGWFIGNSGPMKDGLDGAFGLATEHAVRNAQQRAGFTGSQVDGVVGPQTWPVLLGIA